MPYVNSTAIQWADYNPKTRRMQITFRESGKTYDFCDVPQHVYDGFMTASSKGVYFNDYIKDRYDCF